MGKNPAAQFYWNDYLRDTRILTPAARGIWADMLGFMHYASPRGRLTATYDEFARMLSCKVDEAETAIKEISRTKVGDVIFGNDDVTVINRRMDREEKEREANRLRVAKHRSNASGNAQSNENVTSLSSSSSSKDINTLSSTEPKSAPPTCPHLDIISLYNEILCPPLIPVKPKLWKGKRATHLQARWREDPKRHHVEWWGGIFEYIRDSCPFLMGKVNDFKADMGWIIKDENMVKILEGKYEKTNGRKLNPGNGSGQSRVLDGVSPGADTGKESHPGPAETHGGKGVAPTALSVADDGGRGHGDVEGGH